MLPAEWTSTPWHPLLACALFIVPGVPLINFVDVVLVFQDSYARIEYDPKHSEGEERYRITGSIKGIIVVVVIFTDRNNVTRIISARRATRQEVKDYERRF